MKSVLISIQRPHTDNIKALIKKIEVRKNKPNQETPFPCFIYETKTKGGCGKVIGEFVCDKVYLIKNQGSRFSVADEEQSVTNEIARQSCLDYDDMVSYLGNKDGYGLHITALKIYDKPKELREFFKPCPTKEKGDCLSCDCLADNDYGGVCTNNLTRPPQSYMYVEEE